MTIPPWLQMLLLASSPAGFSLFRWMRALPGPAPTARYGVIPLTGPWGARQAASDTALFNSAFVNQPNIIAATAVGELIMTDPVAQNVTISASVANILTIDGSGGTGVLINNTSAFTLTIDCRVALGAPQTWTNNSGNLFTVSGATLALGE